METNLKDKYKQDFEQVRGFVNEFDCLTNHLLNSVYQNKTKEEIRLLILHEIDHHFSTPDRTIMLESEKTELYNDIDTLLGKLEQHFYKKLNC